MEIDIRIEIEDKRVFNKACLLKNIEDIDINKFESSVANSLNQWEEELKSKDHCSVTMETDGGALNRIYEIEDQLFSIYEMKIIYLFKSLEINLKKLLSTTYSIDTSKKYDWNMLMAILASNKIDFSKIKCHQQVQNIRRVNNFLKHSSQSISDEVKNIKEFKNVTTIEWKDLAKFYNNMKKFPQKWIQDLGHKIYHNLYVFDDERIETMAKSIGLRMNEEKAKLLIQKLEVLYDTPSFE